MALPRSVKAYEVPHPIEAYLTGGDIDRPLSDASARLYGRAAYRLEASGQDPVAWFREQAHDATAAKKTLDGLRTMTAHYMVWRGIAPDLVAARTQLGGTSRGRGEKKRGAMGVEETQDFVVLVDKLTDPLPAVLKLMLYTGIRVSEACGLDVDDVAIYGHRPRIQVLGKGNQPREVELSRDARVVLREHLATVGKKGPWFTWEYSFPGGAFGERILVTRRLQPYVIRRELQAAREAIDPSWTVSPHSLRHTAATDLAEAGVPLHYIKDHLGHKHLAVLEKYVDTRPGRMAEMLERVPRREAE